MTIPTNEQGTDMDINDSGRHPINTGHLVMGLVFAGLLVVWALVSTDVVANSDLRWLLPIPWVAGGAIGLAAAAYANVTSRRGTTHPDPADHDSAPHDSADTYP